MTQAETQKLTCEEARLFMSRELDRDLDRAEIRRLYMHLGACHGCGEHMAELASLESQLAGLNLLYEKQSLNETFNEKLNAAIVRTQPSAPPAGPRKTPLKLMTWLIPQPWARSPVFAGFASALAGFLLFLLVWPNSTIQFSVSEQRFFLHPVEFGSSDSRHPWNDDTILLPGHTLRQVVQRGHDKPYHIRLESKGPVNVVVTHDDSRIENDPAHRLTLHGVRYASLHAPRTGDVIIIRNEGTEPVRVSALTTTPQALNLKLERHIKL